MGLEMQLFPAEAGLREHYSLDIPLAISARLAAMPRRLPKLLTAVAAIIMLIGASEAAYAQNFTWGGTGSTTTTTQYNTGTNWSNPPAGAPPISAGQSAIFDATGNATVSLGISIAPDSWTFSAASQSYAITGSTINFGLSGVTNNASAGQTISITLTGAGSGMTGTTLNQAGTSTLTISGNNNLLTNTSVTAGTLVNDSTLTSTVAVSGTGTLTNGGNIIGTVGITGSGIVNNFSEIAAVNNAATFINNNDGTVTGLLTNTAGTTTNAGVLSGGASVSGGTLTNNNIIIGTVAITGTGIVDNAGTKTITGAVNNAATFNNNGGTVSGLVTTTAGTTNNGGFLNGGASVSGGTFNNNAFVAGGVAVSGGTFNNGNTINGSGTVGITGSGIVNNNGTITVAVNNAGTFNNIGNFSQVSSLFTNTAGTTTNGGTFGAGASASGGTLTNNNTITGTVAITGTGIVNNNLTITGTVNNAATFNNSAGGTVSGLLTNSGTTSNAGMLSGGLTNTAGTTTDTGAIAGMTTITGGLLTGTGSVVNLQVGSAGTFSPGNGTPGSSMTVTGNLAFASGALYLVQLNPSTSSLAKVTGSATLDGATVSAAFAPGTYATNKYTILTAAGGVSGTFAPTVTGTNVPNFKTSLSYDANNAFLNLTASLSSGTSLNPSQQNVANAINGFFNSGGALPPAFASLFALSGPNLANALSLASGEVATGAQQSSQQLMTQFLGLLGDPFAHGFGSTATGTSSFASADAPLPPEAASAYAAAFKTPAPGTVFDQRWSVWASAYGGTNRTDGDPLVGSSRATTDTAGVAVGHEYRVTPDTALGFAMGGGGSAWRLDGGLGSGNSDALQAGVYAKTRSGPLYVTAALAFAEQWISTNRTAFNLDNLTARYNAETYGGRIEAGYRVAVMPSLTLIPYGAAQAQSFNSPAYAELDQSGGPAALNFAKRTANDERGEIGERIEYVAATSPDSVLLLRGKLAYAHDWVTDASLVTAFQALPGTPFVVTGATPAPNSGLASGGFEWRSAGGLALIGKFDTEFAVHSLTLAGTATLRYIW
jgi:uncharacterized protein with beta-barrel porin domain